MSVEELPFHSLTTLLDFVQENTQEKAIHHRMQFTLYVLSNHQTYLNDRRLSSQILRKRLIVNDIVRVTVRIEIEASIRRRSLLNRIDHRGRGGILRVASSKRTTFSLFFDSGSISFVLVNYRESRARTSATPCPFRYRRQNETSSRMN